jgi:hypothetical protein
MHESELLAERLARIEDSLRLLLTERVQKRYYSTSDVAKILGKAEFTVREWCRNSRCRAEKRPCGRGNSKEWMVSHEELVRIQTEGLLVRK